MLAPRLLLPALLVLTLGACASTPNAEKPSLDQQLAERGYKTGDKVDRIADYRIDGWNSIDRRNLIFNAGANRNYLLKLKFDCPGLTSAETIGFTSTVSFVTPLDKLVVRDAGFDNQCPIEEIRELKKTKPAKS